MRNIEQRFLGACGRGISIWGTPRALYTFMSLDSHNARALFLDHDHDHAARFASDITIVLVNLQN